MAWYFKKPKNGTCVCGNCCSPLQFKAIRAYKHRLVGFAPFSGDEVATLRYTTATYTESCALECGWGVDSYHCGSAPYPCDHDPCVEGDCCNEKPITSILRVDRFRGCSKEIGTCYQGPRPANPCVVDDLTPTHYASHCDDEFLECCDSGTSSITLSVPYTFDLLGSDIQAMYESVDWEEDFLDWNMLVEVVGLEEDNFIFPQDKIVVFEASYVTGYDDEFHDFNNDNEYYDYSGTGVDPFWIDKTWLRVRNPSEEPVHYKLTYNRVGEDTPYFISEELTLDAGDEILISPPEEPGYILVIPKNGSGKCFFTANVELGCKSYTKVTHADELPWCATCGFKPDDNGVWHSYLKTVVTGSMTDDNVLSDVSPGGSYIFTSNSSGEFTYTKSYTPSCVLTEEATGTFTSSGVSTYVGNSPPFTEAFTDWITQDASWSAIIRPLGGMDWHCDSGVINATGPDYDILSEEIEAHQGSCESYWDISFRDLISYPSFDLGGSQNHECPRDGFNGPLVYTVESSYEASNNRLDTSWSISQNGVDDPFEIDSKITYSYTTILSVPNDEKLGEFDEETPCGAEICSTYESSNVIDSGDVASTIVNKEITLRAINIPSPEAFSEMEITLLWYEIETPSDCNNPVVGTRKTEAFTLTSSGEEGSRVWSDIPETTTTLEAKAQMGQPGTLCPAYPEAIITSLTRFYE